MRMGLPDIKSPALSQLFCSMFDDLNFPECLWHLRSGQWMKLAWLIQAYTVGHQGAKKDNPSSKTKVFPYWKKISTKFWFCLWLKGYKQNSPCPWEDYKSLGVRHRDESGGHTKLKKFIVGKEPGSLQSKPSLRKRKLRSEEVKWLAQVHRAKRQNST